MFSVGNRAATKAFQLLMAPGGLNTIVTALSQAANISLPLISEKHFFLENVSSELAEKTLEAKYTAVYIYCEKVVNLLREKFRSFSGNIQLAIEVRLSQDRLEGMEQRLELYVDAITHSLNQSRGDWGQGLFYAGSYEAAFGPSKRGGRNFIKVAKIVFHVDASID